MGNVILQVIPKPKEGTASILAMNDPSRLPIIKGSADTNYQCGTCHATLVQGVTQGQIRNMVLLCPKCGSYNRLKGTV